MIVGILVGVIVVLIALLILMGIACKILLKKVELYETWIAQTDETLESLKTEMQSLHAELKDVDDRHLFEKDDDVGFVFTEIVRIIDTFNVRIKDL